MGNMGRITSLKDLPPDRVIIDLMKQAKKLNDDGIKLPPKPKKPKTELVVPDYFVAALRKNKKALVTFESFSYSHKKEYLEWITEAKTEETRNSRLATAVEWMAEGKSRNWKYMRK
ncbi:MAG: YdeI/OmpD-associated family protein [Ignavibacteriae bacterium]|nr:YdeI/OmpD-associated family protein [Ignavibacteriota bacterium]